MEKVMGWILIMVITTLHLEGGTKAVSVTLHESNSRTTCEGVAEKIRLEIYAEHSPRRVEAKHSCIKK